MMPKNTKKCQWCGIRKNIKHFGKDKDYCKSCWYIYLKNFKPKERKILLVSNILKDNKERIRILQKYPKHFKQFRYWVKKIPTDQQGEAWSNIRNILEFL